MIFVKVWSYSITKINLKSNQVMDSKLIYGLMMEQFRQSNILFNPSFTHSKSHRAVRSTCLKILTSTRSTKKLIQEVNLMIRKSNILKTMTVKNIKINLATNSNRLIKKLKSLKI